VKDSLVEEARVAMLEEVLTCFRSLVAVKNDSQRADIRQQHHRAFRLLRLDDVNIILAKLIIGHLAFRLLSHHAHCSATKTGTCLAI